MENNLIPNGFEEVTYKDLSSKENSMYEMEKAPEYDKIVPDIISSIDLYKTGKITQCYPYFVPDNSLHYLPKLDKPSEILNIMQLKQLHSILPDYHKYINLILHYTISVDGTSLKSFYNRCKEKKLNNSLLIIKDSENNIFGAYASEILAPSNHFFGTAECFLFTFYKENKIYVYNSTRKNEHYIYCDSNQICFGCSDDYFSLCLSNNFLEGYSQKTQTYDNECLTNSDKFTIVKFELWGFGG
jgi:hypothetical protein